VTLVVDASVAAKWVLPEPESAAAELLRSAESEIIAPHLIIAEIGNAVWKRARRGELTITKGIEALDAAVRMIDRLHPLDELSARATEIAVKFDHPIYDCFYLALAERERCALATADARLARLAAATKTVPTTRL
jgi:predicted nucleic acid-binding protein